MTLKTEKKFLSALDEALKNVPEEVDFDILEQALMSTGQVTEAEAVACASLAKRTDKDTKEKKMVKLSEIRDDIWPVVKHVRRSAAAQ